jgi:hypothetical protein
MNELVKVSPTEAISLGKTFFESGMFADIKSAQQAVVKIMAGQELGIGAFTAMSGIHIISGKPTIGAGLMASQVKGSGKYDYEVKEHTEKVCSIDFYQGKKLLGNSTFTIEDAKKAGTGSSNNMLGKYPKNMLFARALSNGVKWFTPDVFTGPVYTPEEMQSVTEDATPTEVTTVAKPQKQSLPALSEKQYIQALGRIATGDTEIIEKLEKTFTLTDEQKKGLVEKMETVKQSAPLQITAHEQAPVEQE